MTDTIATHTKIGIRRLAGNIGAEITGVDTGTQLGDDAIAQIRQALLDHKVVFLRGQSLDYARQVAFAERLGPLTLGHPTLASPPDQPFLEEIDSRKGVRANHWHTDVTFVDRPPAFTLLHAVVIPPVGGDTLWANTVTAYESLPEELRDLADRLRITHTNAYDYAASAGREERDDATRQAHRQQFVSTVYETEHPAVRVHPETGGALAGARRVRAHRAGILAAGVPGPDPDPAGVRDPAGADRALAVARGRPGDLGQPGHPALRDLRLRHPAPARRAGHRGRAPPVGVDGHPSVALEGRCSSYYRNAA